MNKNTDQSSSFIRQNSFILRNSSVVSPEKLPIHINSQKYILDSQPQSSPTTVPISGRADILSRFPPFELSYETISHKKVSEPYNVALAIPLGKKYYIWATFAGRRNVCYLMEITRDKRIGNITEIFIEFADSLSFGTVLYGTLSGDDELSKKVFIIEDIFYHNGISVKHHTFSEKLGAIDTLFSTKSILFDTSVDFSFGLPVIWKYTGDDTDSQDKQMTDMCGYTVHHIQYRSLTQIVPYINMSAKPKSQQNTLPIVAVPDIDTMFYGRIPMFNFTKPQYNHNTVFLVKADIQYDIYHLFAYGANKSQIYCGLAGIPTYKTSMIMNGLFRNIRENRNIDYIEESDDEEDFENTQLDKYVWMEKMIPMECSFHKRFKKWVPLHIVPHSHLVIHINKL